MSVSVGSVCVSMCACVLVSYVSECNRAGERERERERGWKKIAPELKEKTKKSLTITKIPIVTFS